MSITFISIGSDLGNREGNIAHARILVAENVGTIVLASSVYETAPWGFESYRLFYNQVVEVDTELTPVELLDSLKKIEKNVGRTEKKVAGAFEPRIVDLDILLYDDLIVNSENLVIPHRFMASRRFELLPLCEIAPDLVHPVSGKTIGEMLSECLDEGYVRKMVTG